MAFATVLLLFAGYFPSLAALFAMIIALVLSVGVYRIYLSPLAGFPGPMMAALTGAYEGYFDCFKDGGGRYYVEISRMHDFYGTLSLLLVS